MNLNDFEQRVNKAILRRGQEYYKDKRVDLAVFRDGVYSANVIGSDEYSVVVKTDAYGNIVAVECDCPYTDGPYCKHVVAVFYAIRERQRAAYAGIRTQGAKVVPLRPADMQVQTTTPPMSKKELSGVLSQQPKARLVEVLTFLSASSEAVREYLQAEFICASNEKAKWARFMERYIKKAMDEDGFISYHDSQYVAEGACQVLERAQQALADGEHELGVDLALYVLHEMVELLDCADDSSGTIGEVIWEAQGILAGVDEYQLSDKVREKCFQTVLAETANSTYNDWIEWRTNLLRLCVDLAATPDNRRRLEQYLDKLMAKLEEEQEGQASSWGYNYNVEQLALVRLAIITRFDGVTQATDFLRKNISFSQFRKLAIEWAVKAEEYVVAERLAQEGEQQDEALPGLVKQWKELRFEIYQRSSQLEKMRALGLEFALTGDFDYYLKLKALYEAAEWQVIYPGIIERMDKSTGYVREGYSKILIEEKEWKKLLEYTQDNPMRILDFYRHLLKEYRVEVYRLFTRFISDEAGRASNRKDYQEVCSHLRLLIKIGGKKEGLGLTETLLQTYKRRPAFREELLSIKEPIS